VNEELVWAPLTEHVKKVREGELSVADIVRAYLQRLEEHDGHLGSHVATNPGALEQAQALDAAIKRGEDTGPLTGAVISVKDNCLTADMPTRAGTSVERLQFGYAESNVVRRLRQSGAVILGKTRMHEFAWGNITAPCRNPWKEGCVPGGSSGGSGAAVAAALCGGAIGTDTGGSIRIPATLCGTVGLKATFGLVGRGGIIPHSWSLDHVGPMTRTVEDSALLLESLEGFDPEDPSTRVRVPRPYRQACGASIEGRSIGIIRNHFTERLSVEVEQAFQSAIDWFRSQGAMVHEFEAPALAHGLGAIFAIELASASAYHDRAVQEGLTQGFDPDVRDLVDMGRFVTGVDYLHAEQLRTLLSRQMAEILETVDVIMTPTSPITAWESGCWEVDVRGTPESVLAASWRFTYPFNLTGMPAISLPAGFNEAGLPIGLQIAGRPFAEPDILSFAAAYERAHDWSALRPASYS